MPETMTSGQRAKRGAWTFTLVIVGSMVALLSTLGAWAERQVLDTDAWVETTDELLADDDVRGALAIYLVDELYESVDVTGAIGEVLPLDFEGLSGILAGALRGPATDVVDRLLATDQVRTLWSEANRLAHSTLVAVLEDDTDDVLSAAGGVVSIDLGELVRSLGERIGLSGNVLDRIPDDAGVIVLFESDELEFAQDAVAAVKVISVILFALVVVLYAAAVYLSVDRRRTLRDCGIGLSVVGLLVLVARLAAIRAVINNLTQADGDEPAWSILSLGSTLLRQVAITELLLGLAMIGFATLVGPSRLARGGRAFLAPALRHGRLSAVIGAIVVYVGFLWISPSGPIDGWILALGFGALCLAGVVWVQRVTMAEFPDMTFAEFRTRAKASIRSSS